jgi:hypothetical protein
LLFAFVYRKGDCVSIQQAMDSLQLKQWGQIGLRSTVARNAASLYLIQFANYIVPLIMIPYLVRVLGPAGYGAVAFAQGLINYLMWSLWNTVLIGRPRERFQSTEMTRKR